MQVQLTNDRNNAAHEKRSVALSSVVAAVFLTAMKLVVGIMTGSLGILAEAAHSGLDLVAAAVTYGAVRVSDKPPDKRHHYGHGKVENLSALVETLLLLITCVWIIYEGTSRLFFKEVEIEANVWAFGVVIVSIVIDFNRSRMLSRAAKKYRSQALEADALHFSTDIWSSTVVLVGLALVRGNEWFGGPPALAKADALAALGVAVIVIWVSIKLGKRSVEVMLDTAPSGLDERIKTRVEQIEGVTTCRQLRIRPAGAETFVDCVLGINGGTSFEHAHQLTHRVEDAVRQVAPGADVLVHYEPDELDRALTSHIRAIAHEMGADVHSIWAREVAGTQHVELHLEVDRDASLEEGHDVASRLETHVKETFPGIAEVVAHIEPRGDTTTGTSRLTGRDRSEMRSSITNLVDTLTTPGACHHVEIWEEGPVLAVSLHCSFSPQASVQEAHELSESIESRLRKEFPKVHRVVIHPEPPSE